MIAAPHAPAFEHLAATASAAWRPRPRPRRSDWCEQNLHLPRRRASQSTRYDLTDRPYLREILDCVDDIETTEVVILGATQVGKSEAVRAIVASQGHVDAAPMMFSGPDQIYARENREYIYEMADETPALAGLVPARRFRNDRAIDLGDCLVYLAWSGSTQRLSGRACKVVLCSEADRWVSRRQENPGQNRSSAPVINSLDLARERPKAFYFSTIVYEGSPIGSSPNLGPLYHDSDRRAWHAPCPKCGHYQEIRFFPNKEGPHRGRGGVGGLQTADGKDKTPEEGRRDAFYNCESCQKPIDQEAFRAMRLRGRWVPRGQHVTPKGNLAGKPAYSGRRRGYRLTSLMAPTINLGDVAEEYLRAKGHQEKLRKFWNDWLALPFEARGKTPKWKDLGRRLAGAHPRGLVPRNCYFLTVAADVQADRVYWIVRAWAGLTTSYLIDFGLFTDPAGSSSKPDDDDAPAVDLSTLDAVLDRRWTIDGENPLGRTWLAPRVLGVDCGYRPATVYDYVRAHPGDRVLAIAGDPKILPGALYRQSKIDRNARTGKAYGRGVRRYGIDTAAYKSDLLDRWFADKNQPGFWWLPSDILDTRGGEDYLRQVTNEARTTEIVNGRRLTRWKIINEGEGNHYLDCEVYARCLADMVVGQNWDARTWIPADPPPATDQEDLAARDEPLELAAR